jgi:hypothetical protein
LLPLSLSLSMSWEWVDFHIVLLHV